MVATLVKKHFFKIDANIPCEYIKDWAKQEDDYDEVGILKNSWLLLGRYSCGIGWYRWYDTMNATLLEFCNEWEGQQWVSSFELRSPLVKRTC